MSYVEKHLIEGETIIYETRLHWIVLVVPILVGLLFGLTGVAMFFLSARTPADSSVASQSMTIIGAACLAIALIFIVRGILKRNATEMTVTNKRVFVKVGTRRAENHRAAVIESGEHRRRGKRDGKNARLRQGDRPRNRRHARGFQHGGASPRIQNASAAADRKIFNEISLAELTKPNWKGTS